METTKPIAPHRTAALLGAGVLSLLAVAAVLPRVGPRSPSPTASQRAEAQAPQDIDLVLAIDTSSSMDGLIDGARQQLWEIVGQLGKRSPRPNLRVGLISYGNTGLRKESGWVQVESDLTTDLDGIYGKLFALRTNGGDEYVARALQVATTRMSWTPRPGARRMFIVAGNEPADQDPQVSLPQALGAAREQRIEVHSIYCGEQSNRESHLWARLAQDGGGRFAAIDHNVQVAAATPMDAELGRLSSALNGTYVPYGSEGGERQRNQAAQDGNAASLGGQAAAARAVAKASALYRNDSWDLVDLAKEGKLAQVKDEELPEELRKLAPAERQRVLEGKARERAALQEQIQRLSEKRGAAMMKAKKQRAPGKKGLDDAFEGLL